MVVIITSTLFVVSSLVALFYMSNKFYKEYLALLAENRELKEQIKRMNIKNETK